MASISDMFVGPKTGKISEPCWLFGIADYIITKRAVLTITMHGAVSPARSAAEIMTVKRRNVNQY
jgi:hypothetical protein